MSFQAYWFNPASGILAAEGSGVRIPRMSTTERLALSLGSGDAGTMVYDLTLDEIYSWDGAAWSAAGSTGSTTYVANVAALKALDVTSHVAFQVFGTRGYYSDNDGGQGGYIYDPTSVAVDNAGTVIAPTTGAGRYLLMQSGVVNVRQFGAKGDGVSNDTAAIQAALDAAKIPYQTANVYSLRSGRVYIPKGEYRITSTLTVWPGMSVIGESQESVHITPEQTGADVFYCETPDGSSSTMIRSYTFETLTITQKAGTVPTSGAAIRIRPQTITGTPTPPSVASKIAIKSVYIFGTFRGLHATAIQGGIVDQLSVFNCRETGVLFDAYQTFLQIRGSCSSANGQGGAGQGWRIEGPSYCSLTGVSADSNAGYGYYLTNSSEQSCYANVLDVGAEGNSTGGVFLQNQNSCRVTALCIMQPGVVAQDGITVDGAGSDVLLLGCYVPTQTLCTGFALKVTNGPTNGSTPVSVYGGFLGLFNGGANIVSTTTPIDFIGYQSANRLGYGLTAPPSRPYDFARRTYAAGTAGREMMRLSDVSTDSAGSTKWTITPDQGNALGEIEQNSLVSGPFSYSTTLGDTLIRNSYTASGGLFGCIKFVAGSTVAMTIGNGTRRGQVAVGTQTPDVSAQFQVDSTTLGFLPPRMTTAQKTAIATPASGLVVYDTTLKKLCVYTGAAWETVTSV